MKAIFLTKTGDAQHAFQVKEIDKPTPKSGQVLIKVEAFGLNFADVMARRGMYKDAPPIPCVLGYDVAGTIEGLGEGVTGFCLGDRVMAMSRFGGYAEYAITEALAMAAIPKNTDVAAATALTTQYGTAYYAAAEAVNLFSGDKVLIQSGAGGVGTALIQFAKHKGCEIFATAGSQQKIDYLRAAGVHHAINYRTQNFETEIKSITGAKGVDVIFDAVGGKSIKQGMRLLNAGGKLVCYGASVLNGSNAFGKLSSLIAFGFYHPAMLMMPSKSLIGINMLKIADNKPQVIQRCLREVARLTEEGVFVPTVSKVFAASAIGAAHEYLETRQSMGKVVVEW